MNLIELSNSELEIVSGSQLLMAIGVSTGAAALGCTASIVADSVRFAHDRYFIGKNVNICFSSNDSTCSFYPLGACLSGSAYGIAYLAIPVIGSRTVQAFTNAQKAKSA